MKRRIIISCLLVVMLAFSTVTLGACDLFSGLFGSGDNGGENNPPDNVDEKPDSDVNPDVGETPDDNDPTDVPVLSELKDDFYNAANWEFMTNKNGESLDGGDIAYSMKDGSIKFHRANQAFEYGDLTNATASFMLKATNDFSIWFNSSTKDNANNSSYRLNYAYGQLRIALSSAPEQAAAVISEDYYNKGQWNRFDISFSTVDGVCEIKVYINGKRAALSSGDNTTPMVSVEDNILTHTQPAMFTTGNYIVVKVWGALNYVQLKPVEADSEEDVPVIACIGASITEGAGAGNFYTESYPAQLQNALDGMYNVINFGNSGKTVRTDLGDDVSWLAQEQWIGVQAIAPDIAILNIGTNDSKTSNNPVSTYESFYKAYKFLIDSLLSVNPDMQILICTVPYAHSNIWDISNDNIANIIAPVQRELAEEYGFTLIDLYEYTKDASHLFTDGVHPSTTGYEMLVKIIKKALIEGEEALTEEFIGSTLEEFAPQVPNAYVELDSVVLDGSILTLKGKTNDPDLIFYVGNNDNLSQFQHSEKVVSSEDGSFTVSLDLKTMTVGGWYNVRFYYTDGRHISVSLDQLTDPSGNSFSLWQKIPYDTTQVEICSWNDGAIRTLSFAVTEYTSDYYLKGGRISKDNMPFSLVAENDTAYLKFASEINVSGIKATSIELIITLEDNSSELPESLDESKIVYIAQNLYNGDNASAFEFNIDVNDIGKQSGWMRFVLKVTQGDSVYYLNIKPHVESHSGDWIAIGPAITLNGVKWELAICWSSLFIQSA